MKIHICSFSIKQGYPLIDTIHGGGHVFDCRLLPNPGRIDSLKHLTGMDEAVSGWLRERKEVAEFINLTSGIVLLSLKNYLERGFDFMSVGFGCTGGQHRSVYCAFAIAGFLQSEIDSMNTALPISVHLRHLGLESIEAKREKDA